MSDTLEALRQKTLRRFTPPQKTDLATWVEKTLRLPDTVSATPGAVKLWPYQRGIAAALSDPNVERVTVQKSVRIGYSFLLTSFLLSHAQNDPCSQLLILPADADCRDFVTSELEPTMDSSPALRGLMSEEADPNGRSTMLSRRFSGGSLRILAARSPRNLRRMTARIVAFDETSAFERTKEGDPIQLGIRRSLSFANRKILMGSTPVYADDAIITSYLASDQRIFEIPCPECGAFHAPVWADIVWNRGQPDTAALKCPHCTAVIAEKFKAQMVEAGQWRATKPFTGHAGFKINALTSTLKNASWAKIAEEFLESKDDASKLQVVVNTLFGEPWSNATDELDDSALEKKAQPFSLEAIPEDVICITSGTDLQDDRAETTLVGWAKDGTQYVLGHVVIYGSPQDDSMWQELDGLLKLEYDHPLGGKIRVDAAIIDSGDGEHTSKCYEFTRTRLHRRIFSGKGMAGNRPTVTRSKAKNITLIIIGVDGIKSNLYGNITAGKKIHFSNTLESRFYTELASERRILKYYKGQPSRMWQRKSGMRAECLDSTVYATAARSLVTINYDSRIAELKREPLAPMGMKPGAVFKSNWLQGSRA
jgi:phage terminase large subunit GpA-like protein